MEVIIMHVRVLDQHIDGVSTSVKETTVIPSCSLAFPLLNADLPSPGDHAAQLIPADTAAVGETITVYYIQGNPSTLGSIVAVTFDNGMTAQQNFDNYPTAGNFFEQFTMTCTPSGLRDVSIVEKTGPLASPIIVGPKNGIGSMPGAIACQS
uniref:Uncharacterized protein n=1 Tax=Plectus sambesii TaxID=2011161 RepID=A0A914VZ23_9BILA